MEFEVRRYRDILAFKTDPQGPVLAFHGSKMELAEISPEAWSQLKETSLNRAEPWENLLESEDSHEAAKELVSWASEKAESPSESLDIQTLTLNVTQICNLHCHYCAAGGDGTYNDPVKLLSLEKTLPQIRRFIEALSPGLGFRIIFLGGEPMLYPEALAAVGDFAQDLCISKGLKFQATIITNGTLLNRINLELFKFFKPHFILSMDGDPETQDRVRPQKNGVGSSQATLQGLEVLLQNRSCIGSITIHAVFNRQNWDVLKAYKFFESFPVDRYDFTFDITEKDPETNQKFIEGMASIAKEASEKGESSLRKIASFDSVFSALDQQFLKTSHCGSGKNLLSLSSRGEIFSCPLEVSYPRNRLSDDPKDLQSQRSRLFKPLIELNDCKSCWARHHCGGGCMFNHKSLTGNPHQKHESYCYRTRSLLLVAFMYYKKLRDNDRGGPNV